jgi:hypothetical protein
LDIWQFANKEDLDPDKSCYVRCSASEPYEPPITTERRTGTTAAPLEQLYLFIELVTTVRVRSTEEIEKQKSRHAKKEIKERRKRVASERSKAAAASTAAAASNNKPPLSRSNTAGALAGTGAGTGTGTASVNNSTSFFGTSFFRRGGVLGSGATSKANSEKSLLMSANKEEMDAIKNRQRRADSEGGDRDRDRDRDRDKDDDLNGDRRSSSRPKSKRLGGVDRNRDKDDDEEEEEDRDEGEKFRPKRWDGDDGDRDADHGDGSDDDDIDYDNNDRNNNNRDGEHNTGGFSPTNTVEMCSGWAMIPIAATLRGSVRKLKVPMYGGTPFAVVKVLGEDVPKRKGVWETMKRIIGIKIKSILEINITPSLPNAYDPVVLQQQMQSQLLQQQQQQGVLGQSQLLRGSINAAPNSAGAMTISQSFSQTLTSSSRRTFPVHRRLTDLLPLNVVIPTNTLSIVGLYRANLLRFQTDILDTTGDRILPQTGDLPLASPLFSSFPRMLSDPGKGVSRSCLTSPPT